MTAQTYNQPQMDEKTPLETTLSPQTHSLQQPHPNSRQSILKRFLPAFLLTLSSLFLFRSLFVDNGHYDPAKALTPAKVPLEAHIMSKCPDARDCLRELIVPAMERVSSKVDFKLSYIGSIKGHTDEVSCMHGPSECLGNMIQLCAARIYPDPKLYLGFATCMTSNYSQIPDRDLVEYCAMEHGIDFERVNKCISDEGHGTGLLRDSIERSADLNVTKSCTVRLNDEVRCIRDGGKWYDCPGGSEVDDLVRDIEKLYDEENDAVR